MATQPSGDEDPHLDPQIFLHKHAFLTYGTGGEKFYGHIHRFAQGDKYNRWTRYQLQLTSPRTYLQHRTHAYFSSRQSDVLTAFPDAREVDAKLPCRAAVKGVSDGRTSTGEFMNGILSMEKSISMVFLASYFSYLGKEPKSHTV